MPSLRNLGGVDLAKNVFDDWSWFFKFTVGGTTYRYTDMARPVNTGQFVGNIDGSSQTWIERWLSVPKIDQNAQGLYTVSSIEVDNVDNVFGNLANSPGLRGASYELWCAYFIPGTSGPGQTPVIDGIPFRFVAGVLDDSQWVVDSQERPVGQITLIPSLASFARMVLGPGLGALCVNIFKDPTTCQYVGPDSTCDKTRTGSNGCRNRTGGTNEVHFNGADLNPAPGTTVTWHYQIITTTRANTSTHAGNTPPPPPPTTSYGPTGKPHIVRGRR